MQHCTWLGFHPRAAGGGSRAREETPGRVGELTRMTGLFFFAIWKVFFRATPPNVQHCTWLGFRPRAASGGRRARGETPGRVGEPRRKSGFSFCACTGDMLLFRVVPIQRATLYLVRFPPARRQWRKKSAGGNARESRTLPDSTKRKPRQESGFSLSKKVASCGLF